jgi:hypothetical protein
MCDARACGARVFIDCRLKMIAMPATSFGIDLMQRGYAGEKMRAKNN